MAESVFKNGLLLLAGLNLQAQTRELELQLSADAPSSTALDDTYMTRLAGGIKDVALSSAGYFDAEEPDASLFAAVGVADSLITVTPTTTLGDRSFFFRAVVGTYNAIEGAVGEAHMYTLEAAANLGELYRGTLMENGQFTVTGNGTGRQIGVVASGESLFAGIHITAITGDWDIIIESDDNTDFSSAVTRATFAAVTTVGDQFTSVAGAITDDWWRVRFVENSSGSITLVSSLAIQ